MTIVDTMLRGIRTTEGTILRVRLDPGARYRIPVRAPLVLCGLVSGSLTMDGIALEPGGVVVLRGSDPVTPQAGAAGAVLLVCEYPAPDNGFRLTALPEVIVVAPDSPDCADLLRLLDRRLELDEPPAVRDRLLDWLLTCTLNAWYAKPSGSPGALADPMVGPALAAMQAEPARHWTVGELAARSGLGRAAFAKRFREVVGSAPLAYLRDWRMTLAAEYLSSPDATISAVARKVGYTNAFSFSAAFKRERGIAPSAHRGQPG